MHTSLFPARTYVVPGIFLTSIVSVSMPTFACDQQTLMLGEQIFLPESSTILQTYGINNYSNRGLRSVELKIEDGPPLRCYEGNYLAQYGLPRVNVFKCVDPTGSMSEKYIDDLGIYTKDTPPSYHAFSLVGTPESTTTCQVTADNKYAFRIDKRSNIFTLPVTKQRITITYSDWQVRPVMSLNDF